MAGAVSYDLEAIAQSGASATVDAVRSALGARGIATSVRAGRVCVDGGGFTVEATSRGAKLAAGTDRGTRDEHAMAYAALDLAGANGTVLDRPTGARWSPALLGEWLAVAPLLTGRALAVNEERIRHAVDQPAVSQFGAYVEALAAHGIGGTASGLFAARLHGELSHHVARTPLAWAVARGLAYLGDYARLDVLARDATHPVDGTGRDAYTVATDFGVRALPFFERALGDADPNVRRAAARVLHAVGDPTVVPLVLRALSDKRSTVREAVLERGMEGVMALPGARDVVCAALDRIANDPSSVVRKLGAKVMR